MKFKDKIYCDKCRVDTNHVTVYESGTLLRRIVPRIRTNDNQFENMEDIFHVAQCSGCDSIKFVKEFHFKKVDEWNSYYTVYPNPVPRLGLIQNVSFKNLPDSLFFLTTEVHIAFIEKLYSLCAVGLRMIVEAICIDKSVKGNRLIDKINNLKNDGFITELQAVILHQVRLLGNESAHNIKSHEEGILLEGVNVINSILYNIYGLEDTKIYSERNGGNNTN